VGCGTSTQLSPEVCESGVLVCDVAGSVCENFDIPGPVCNYLNVACINFALLCGNSPGSEEYKKAESDLKFATDIYNKWLIKYKKEKLNEK